MHRFLYRIEQLFGNIQLSSSESRRNICEIKEMKGILSTRFVWSITSKFLSTKKVFYCELKGLNRFDRLPLGINVAQVIFQQMMDTLMNDVASKIAYLDDILINSENQEKYAKYDKKVFEKIKQYSWKLSLYESEFLKFKINILNRW